MRDLFPGYYRPEEGTLRQMMQSATVILDTSSLLNLYRYPRQARADLLSVLRKISDRLWMPHQVALEFQANRLAAISEQLSRFKEVKKIIADAEGSLRSQLEHLQLDKRHSSIDSKSFIGRVSRAVIQFSQKLDELEKTQPDVYQDDDVRIQLDDLFRGKIGAQPSNDLLTVIYEEGKERYKSRIPPGYMDQTKEGTVYTYGGLTIERRYGDLILWYQIIEEAKRSKLKDIILVTDDEKEDWWWIVESRGKKTIGPRPELIHEIISKTDVAMFYMYNSERFLRFAAEHLGVKLGRGSVEKVGDVARLYSGMTRSRMEMRVSEAVLAWLLKKFDVIREAKGSPDFICTTPETGLRFGYEVKYVRGTFLLPSMLRNILDVATNMLMEKNLDEITFVFVFRDHVSAEMACRFFARRSEGNLPSRVRLLAGVLAGDPPEFIPTDGVLGQ